MLSETCMKKSVVSFFEELEEKNFNKNIDDTIENAYIKDQTIKTIADSLEIRTSKFENVILSDVCMEGFSFIHVIFENCDLSNADFSESTIHNVVFKNCKLIGTNFSKSSIMNVQIENSIMTYSNFSVCRIRKLEIERTNASFGCFNDVVFKDILLEDCDFSVIDGILIQSHDIKGMITNERGAISLASILGIIVK